MVKTLLYDQSTTRSTTRRKQLQLPDSCELQDDPAAVILWLPLPMSLRCGLCAKTLYTRFFSGREGHPKAFQRGGVRNEHAGIDNSFI